MEKELFERILELCKMKRYSQAALADALNILQPTFHRWLNSKSQKNLYEHLPAILSLFPDVRPEWLYCGIGEPLKTEVTSNQHIEALLEKMAKMEEEMSALKRDMAEMRKAFKRLENAQAANAVAASKSDQAHVA